MFLNLSKSDYENSLKDVADTVLYENTISLTKECTNYNTMPQASCHWKTSAVYGEFWRRNKADYYFEAFRQAQLAMGRTKAVNGITRQMAG